MLRLTNAMTPQCASKARLIRSWIAILVLFGLFAGCSADAALGVDDAGETDANVPNPSEEPTSCAETLPYSVDDCDDNETAELMKRADRDRDGLSDYEELCVHLSDPCEEDSDGDGAADLVEAVYGSDPHDPEDHPDARGDVLFVLPFEAEASPSKAKREFETALRDVDLYMLLDTTGSLQRPVVSLKESLGTFLPLARERIANLWFGLGEHRDYAVAPYGSPGDFVFKNRQSLTESPEEMLGSLSRLSDPAGGNDGAEAQIPALYALATGEALESVELSQTPAAEPCPEGRWGYACFRDEAMPVVVLITDSPFHNGPGNGAPYNAETLQGHAPTYGETIAALHARNIRVMGIYPQAMRLAPLQQLALDTRAVDSDGEALVRAWVDGRIGEVLLTLTELLRNNTRLDITAQGENVPAQLEGDENEELDAIATFIERIEANAEGGASRGCDARAAEDRGGEGYNDTFPSVFVRQRVCFDIVPRANTSVSPKETPQLFRAKVKILGDGYTKLDERELLFFVPAAE